jgi:hypothetical protein
MSSMAATASLVRRAYDLLQAPDFSPYRVHPFASVFPLVTNVDDFVALVEDIRDHGLQTKIVLTADGETIVDGRNRYLALKILYGGDLCKLFEGPNGILAPFGVGMPFPFTGCHTRTPKSKSSRTSAL